MNHHFISHSSVDGAEFAGRLATALSSVERPVQVWLDEWGEIRPGYDWDDQVEEAIENCASLIFVMTPDSVLSNSECNWEWTWALRLKKPIIPVLLDGETKVPPRLRSREYVDFTTSFDDGLARLRGHLEWLSSAAGELTQLKYRLREAQRDLRRARVQDRPRIEAEITALNVEIARKQPVVDDRQLAANRVQERIARAQEAERQPGYEERGPARGRFINPAPAAAPSYFQDRSVETGLVCQFLKDESRRLLTVTGRGGTGKTAMVCRVLKALERGEGLDDRAPLSVDGIVYLSAAGFHRVTVPNIYAGLTKLLPEDEAARIEAVYKDPRTSTEETMQTLLAAFPGGRVVLLLDNFEDVVDPATLNVRDAELSRALTSLLASAQHAVKVILTSRIAPRDLALANPGRQSRLDLNEGLPEPFAENILRDMDADGTLGLRDAPAEVLAEARVRTRGYPRALEALFAILSADRDATLEEILTAASGSLPENVVKDLVGEAFNRLDAEAQRVMECLSIYGRPVTAAAVDFLLQPYVEGVDSAVTLSRLVNMHFVRREAGRYYLHPVDRAFAAGRVPKGGVSDRGADPPRFTTFALLHRAAEYFKAIRVPAEKWKSIEDLTAQLAEFELRIAAEEYGLAAEALLEIDCTCQTWGHYTLAVTNLERLQGKLDDADLRRRSVRGLGNAYTSLGRYEDAIRCYEEDLALSDQLGLESDGAWARHNLAWCYNELGQLAYAAELGEQALEVAVRTADENLQGAALSNLGWYYGKLGRTAVAIDCCEEALTIFSSTVDRIDAKSLVLSNLAGLLIDEGRHEQAIERAQQSLEIGRQINAPIIGNWSGGFLALAYLAAGQLAAARAAAETARQYDEPENNSNVSLVLGITALKQKERTAARDAFAMAVAQADAMLARSARNYNALYAKAVAFCGLGLCEGQQPVSAAIGAYRTAQSICSEAGVVGRIVRLMDLLAEEDPEQMLSEIRSLAATA